MLRPKQPPDLDAVINAIIKPPGMRRARDTIQVAKQASCALERVSGGLSSRLAERARFADTAAFLLSDRDVTWLALMPRELRMMIITLLYWDLRTWLCPALFESEVELAREAQDLCDPSKIRNF